jgi:betaine-aldehyde dehydrogenase
VEQRHKGCGKSPLLIFEDANLDSDVLVACEANFINNGQVCSNATRVLVQATILEEFANRLCQRLQNNVVMGDNLDSKTNLGPMMMHPGQPSQHFDRVMGILERAKQQSTVQVLYGGNGYQGELGGYFVEPTVLLVESDDLEIVREEVFGPIMTILAFDSEEEAVARANASEYGLGAGVMTKDVMRAHRLAKQLQSGNVWINNWNVTPVEVRTCHCFWNIETYGYVSQQHSFALFLKDALWSFQSKCLWTRTRE